MSTTLTEETHSQPEESPGIGQSVRNYWERVRGGDLGCREPVRGKAHRARTLMQSGPSSAIDVRPSRRRVVSISSRRMSTTRCTPASPPAMSP